MLRADALQSQYIFYIHFRFLSHQLQRSGADGIHRYMLVFEAIDYRHQFKQISKHLCRIKIIVYKLVQLLYKLYALIIQFAVGCGLRVAGCRLPVNCQ